MKLLAVGLAGAWFAVGAAQAAPPSIRANAEPATVGVGDTVRYVVEARLDADGVDLSSVRIFADVGPFSLARPTRITRTTDGSALVVRLEQQLTCLDLACAPIRGLRRIRLPAAHVSLRLAGGGTTTGRATSVAIAVEPRVSNAAVDAASPPFRQQTALPSEFRRARRRVALLAIATAIFGLVAVAFAVLAMRPRPTAQPRGAELARALRLLRESTTRSASDRRRAAGLVSRVAGETGAPALAEDAAHLAWSAVSPEPAGAEALAERAAGTAG
jgi:hypothetical protein